MTLTWIPVLGIPYRRMLLTEYAKREGHGVIQRLTDQARYIDRNGDTRHVSYKTVWKACTLGAAVPNYDCAVALSEATGGKCSVDEIRRPHLFGGRKRKKVA